MQFLPLQRLVDIRRVVARPATTTQDEATGGVTKGRVCLVLVHGRSLVLDTTHV